LRIRPRVNKTKQPKKNFFGCFSFISNVGSNSNPL
jgi:hypothetical protein